MINPKSRTIEWITDAAHLLGIRDIALVEKTIRAFSLLEALARSDCPFLFKGESSLMLHLNTRKRLLIDIDIICPLGTVIEDYLNQYAQEYGFGKVELVERISRTDVRKLEFVHVLTSVTRIANICDNQAMHMVNNPLHLNR